MSKKPWWLYRQSAAIPYTFEENEIKIIIVTTRFKKNWTIPKGVVERFLSPSESAAQEALEEAGVKGKISDDEFAEYKYEKWGGTCHVKVFPLLVKEVLKEWPEMNKRERKIADISEAIELVKAAQVPMLKKFRAFV